MWEKLKILSSSVWTFLLPFVRQMISKSGTILAAAALEAVKAVASNLTGATNNEKRDLAFNSIVRNLESQGIKVGVDVGTSLVYAAIETAVQAMKAETPIQ
jgi:hypothetical protein